MEGEVWDVAVQMVVGVLFVGCGSLPFLGFVFWCASIEGAFSFCHFGRLLPRDLCPCLELWLGAGLMVWGQRIEEAGAVRRCREISR